MKNKTVEIESNNNNNNNNNTDKIFNGKKNSDNILLNLKIIFKIKEYEKLNTYNDDLSIDQTYFQYFTRKYYNNNRLNTINTIEEIVDEALNITDDTLNLDISSKTKSNVLDEEPSQLLHRFVLEMTNATRGLDNLKKTYKEDVSILSKLDLLIEKLNTRVNKVSKILTINV